MSFEFSGKISLYVSKFSLSCFSLSSFSFEMASCGIILLIGILIRFLCFYCSVWFFCSWWLIRVIRLPVRRLLISFSPSSSIFLEFFIGDSEVN